ncbi:MAG TPA: iron-sulfur cluster assembly scaffold protein [Patescibacteria group bacterium]|nr:iron-sulfur cluster assembly scaffold protein [Patescibacteria group bacterium]
MDDTLYREELMEVYKNTKNRGTLSSPSVEVLEKNPLCGDQIKLQFEIEDGVIKNAKFDASACAVSVISSAYLLDKLFGKTLEQAKKITKEELLDTLGINLTTSRVKCATLALEGLKHALEKYENTKK